MPKTQAKEYDAMQAFDYSKGEKLKPAKFKGYVEFTPNDLQKELYATSYDEIVENMPEALLQLFGQHYTLTVKQQADRTCYLATMMQHGGIPSEANGYILTARDETPHGALVKILYYHLYCLKGDWSQNLPDDTPKPKKELW